MFDRNVRLMRITKKQSGGKKTNALSIAREEKIHEDFQNDMGNKGDYQKDLTSCRREEEEESE